MKRTYTCSITSRTSGSPEAEMVVSTGAVDREGDRVAMAGLDTSRYMKNPALLWAHQHYEVPIGSVTALTKGADSIRARWRWLEGDPLASRVRNAWDQNVIRGASIGFLSHERRKNAYGGLDHISTELLEVSLVPVPANPEAVRVLRSLRLLDEAHYDVNAREVRDAIGALIGREARAEVWRRWPNKVPVLDLEDDELTVADAREIADAFSSVVGAEVREALERELGRLRGRVSH